MHERYAIRGSIRQAKLSLLGARQALLAGVDEEDCILTPSDMVLVRAELRDMKILMSDIAKMTGKFGTVADARKALV